MLQLLSFSWGKVSLGCFKRSWSPIKTDWRTNSATSLFCSVVFMSYRKPTTFANLPWNWACNRSLFLAPALRCVSGHPICVIEKWGSALRVGKQKEQNESFHERRAAATGTAERLMTSRVPMATPRPEKLSQHLRRCSDVKKKKSFTLEVVIVIKADYKSLH